MAGEINILFLTAQKSQILYIPFADRLPGPPQSLKAVLVGANFADISWDPPTRNPDAAQNYRYKKNIF
jgi:hypothetical protein